MSVGLEEGRMSAFVIADMEPTDESRFMEYGRKAAEVTRKYGGRPLVVGGEPRVFEGTVRPHFVVVIEFPTMGDLQRWYDSEEYRALIQLRQRAAKTDLVAVEGVKPAGAGPPPAPS
jgi:uncharacterized protein (DUF1330 family)